MCLELICEICQIPVHLLHEQNGTILIEKTTYEQPLTNMSLATHVYVLVVNEMTPDGGKISYDALTFVEKPPKILSSVPDIETTIVAIEQHLHDYKKLNRKLSKRSF
jgi:hypothetical protein